METIEVPAPTAWPLVLAVGVAFIFAGLLTNVSVSVLGIVLALAGCVGWFQEVFPREHEEAVPVAPEDRQVTTERRVVERLAVAPEQVRAWLPVETYPVSAGGRAAGPSIAMAVLASGYGLVTAGSVWYPINLRGRGLCAVTAGARAIKCLSSGQLCHRSGRVVWSTLIGLLHGAMLPMLPRRPIPARRRDRPGDVDGPLHRFWALNLLLASRIDWFWFAVSAGRLRRRRRASSFGIHRNRRSRTPFVLRADRAPGTMAPEETRS